MKNSNAVDIALMAVGSAYSLANLEQILGIIILVIQIGWITTKLAVKIYQMFKSKEDLEIIEDEVDEFVEILEDLKDDIKSTNEDENNADSRQQK